MLMKSFTKRALWLPVVLLLMLFRSSQIKAQVGLTRVNSIEGVNEYALQNGLHVVLIPDESQTNIAVNIVYKVGSRHEGYGETGMAHLIEHMLFKQCKKFTDIKKAIADKGAFANGTTWYDRTNYYEILSSSDENLRWAIDMESDRMVNSKILPEELAKEFSVVRNEFEMGENYADNILLERVLSTMYLWHNYGKATIGSKEDIERVKADNLRVFYKKYYQPDNAVLIIGGKFDEKKALQYIQQYFGPIPKPERVLQASYTVEPPQDGERDVTLRRTGDIQYIGLGYHTPSFADKDFAANTALLQILTNDPSGILYKKLVETKMATAVSGDAQVLHDPGFTYFQVDVPKGKSLDSARQVLYAAMNGLSDNDITEEGLTRAKNTLLKNMENTNNNTERFTIALTEYVGAGDWRLWYMDRDRVEKLTVDDVRAVVKKYYKSSNMTCGLFIPDASPDRAVVAETPDIPSLLNGYKGKGAVAQKANFENSIANIKKNTEYDTLSNGAQYALLQKPTKGDKITADITLRYGEETSLMNKKFAPDLLANMLKAGTATRSRKQISDELDRIKTDISFSGSSTGLHISISTDKQNLQAALSLLDDLLKNSRFDSTEFEKSKLESKANIEANQNDPQTMAFEKLNKLSTRYPKGHPYYASSSAESLEDLANTSLQDVKAFYRDFYGANNSVSSFVGELDKPVVKDFLGKTFGSWNSKMKYSMIAPQYFDIKATNETIKTPDKTNATLAGNINLNISEKHPDYPSVFMANELLGGGAFLSSRIPQRLREKEGMSYGAGSFMNSYYQFDVTNWGLYAIFNPVYQGRLDSALRQEINKALTGGFTKDELEKSKSAWLEGNRTSLGDNGFLARILRRYMIDRRPLEEFTGFEDKVKALTVDAVNNALRKYFELSKLVMVYGGDFDKGKPQEKKAF
jgi:zinc protease